MICRLLVIACLGLLVGCGGLKGNFYADPYPNASLTDSDELIGEGLSTKRLEDLYAKSGIPGWDPSLEAELKKWEQQVKFDVPIQMNKQVKAYLVYFSTERKEIIRRCLARSTHYLPMIKETFQEYGLPEDLAYLAMIESGFNPNAYSPAGACGLWQFIKSTGLRYGLVINGYVDERRDPVKSTRAAAQYLSDLYKQFGSWYLAAASYNCGERRVQEELRKGNHRNFWELSAHRRLPNETKNYVPQMIAATIIAKNPERFGFRNVPYQQLLAPEKLQVAQSTKDIGLLGMAKPEVASRPAETHIQNPKGQATQVTPAKGSKRLAHRANKGNSGTYVASLFGDLSAAPTKDKAEKNKSRRRGSVYAKKKKSHQKVISKRKKQSPALLAMRGKSNYTKARIRKKSSSSRKNGKLVRTKPKPLLVSRVR
jgi:hypothetical protein